MYELYNNQINNAYIEIPGENLNFSKYNIQFLYIHIQLFHFTLNIHLYIYIYINIYMSCSYFTDKIIPMALFR